MAQPFVTRGGAVGIGEESVYGTSVARTNWRPLRPGESVQRRTVTSPIDDLYVGKGFGSPRRAVDAEEVGGRIPLLMSYTRVGMWLKHMLGAVVTTGSGPYTHTYKPAALPTSLTIEKLRGTATNSETVKGVKVSGWEMSVSARQRMMLDIDVMCETTNRSTAGSETFGGADDFVLHSQAGNLNFNSVNYTLISMSLKGDNGLERRDQLESILTDEPAESQNRVYTLEFEMEDGDDNLYTAEAAQTGADVTITFTGLVNNSMAITLRNCTVEISDTLTTRGILKRTGTFYGKPDGTDEALQIVVTNDNTGGTAN